MCWRSVRRRYGCVAPRAATFDQAILGGGEEVLQTDSVLTRIEPAAMHRQSDRHARTSGRSGNEDYSRSVPTTASRDFGRSPTFISELIEVSHGRRARRPRPPRRPSSMATEAGARRRSPQARARSLRRGGGMSRDARHWPTARSVGHCRGRGVGCTLAREDPFAGHLRRRSRRQRRPREPRDPTRPALGRWLSRGFRPRAIRPPRGSASWPAPDWQRASSRASYRPPRRDVSTRCSCQARKTDGAGSMPTPAGSTFTLRRSPATKISSIARRSTRCSAEARCTRCRPRKCRRTPHCASYRC
jgi:hypothetical protein